MSKIEINNVYKIFGNNPSSVLPMVKDGATKDEILEQTGHTVGLDNVSLKIEEGETFVCMGLSGSGKSTLIRHLNRLIDPTDGEILVEGTNVMSLDKDKLIEFRRHKMSMVFQRFGLFPHKTVLQNVGYGLEMQGKPEDERDRTAMEKIDARRTGVNKPLRVDTFQKLARFLGCGMDTVKISFRIPVVFAFKLGTDFLKKLTGYFYQCRPHRIGCSVGVPLKMHT